MNILLVLIPVTLLVIGVAVGLFFWAVNHQQFDDLDSPGVLPLLDSEDDPAPAGSCLAPHEKAAEEALPDATRRNATQPSASAAAPPVTGAAGRDQPT
ncbi:MAG: cbb3-type cytochrome oxidase assembly protein CcoS [Rhodanobacter sp.]